MKNLPLRRLAPLLLLLVLTPWAYWQFSPPSPPQPNPVAGVTLPATPRIARSPASASASAQGPTSTPVTVSRQKEEAIARTAAFTDWLTAWRRADASAQPALIAAGRELALARRDALKHLIQTDPRLALELAVPVGLRRELPAEVEGQLERRIDNRGNLEVTIGCFGPVTRLDRTALIGGQHFAVHTFGRRAEQHTKFGLPLHGIAVDDVAALSDVPYRELDEGEKATGGLSAELPAVMVGAKLVRLADRAELERLNEQLIAAESKEGPYVTNQDLGGSKTSTAAPPVAANTPWILGAKRVLWVQVDFADDPGGVATPAEIAVTNTQVSDFYAAVSQGRTTMTFAILPAVLRLPRDKSYYNSSSSTVVTLQSDAAVLAKAYDAANGNAGTYDPDRYDRWIVLFKRMPAYSFGGQAQLTGPQVRMNGGISPGTTYHELGHTQGLAHSHYWLPAGTSGVGAGTHVEYGDVFDAMGSSGSSLNNHFNAAQKAKIGYLDPDTITPVSQSGTYRIARHDHKDAAGLRALRIAPADLGYEYWVEHRRFGPTSFNSAQLDRVTNGVHLHWGQGKAPKFTSGPGSYLVDATAGSAGGANDAPVRIGESFVDPDAGVTVKPVAIGGTAPNEYIDVQVSFGAIDGNRNPVLVADAPAGTLVARTNVIFSASATDPDNDPLYFRWDFGDGSLQPNLGSITRRFTKGGAYSLRVSAHDGKGGIAAKNLALNVSDPLVEWTRRGEGVTTQTLYGVIYAAGRFVAVGDNSTVLTSTDGTTWSRVTAPTGHAYRGIAHSGTRFVAAGIGPSPTVRGGAAYSNDGLTWTAATLPAGVGIIGAVAYGAGQFVAVGENGRIYTSADGAAWSEAASPVTVLLRTVAFANGLFVIGADSGRILTSPDGLTWTNRSLPTANALLTVARHNDLWHAASATQECFTSSDAITWTRTATAGRPNATWRTLSTAGVYFGTTANGGVTFAEDIRSWTTYQVDATSGVTFWSAIDGASRIVIVGTGGRIYTAVQPTSTTPPLPVPSLRNEADSLKVSVGRKNVLAASGVGFTKLELYANGSKVSELNATAGALSWTPAALGSYSLVVRGVTASGESVVSEAVPAVAGMPNWNWRNPSPLGADLNAAVRVGERWWAVGRAGAFVTIDGSGAIEPIDFPTTQHLNGIAYANGRFVVVGPYLDAGSREEIGSIWTSTDGYSWTPLLTTVFDNFILYGVGYGADKWVVVGSGGMLLTSTDGVAWTRQISGTTSQLRSVTYANNQWVTVGAGGRILTSPDAVRWTERSSGTTNDLWAVAATSTGWVAAGLSGTIVRSADAVTWTRATTPVTSSLFHVTAWNGSFLAVGNSGVALASPDGAAWTTVSVDGKFSDLFFADGVGNSGLLIGRAGEVYVSSNGNTGWRRATQGTAEPRQAVTYAGGRFVSVGQTTDPITRTAVMSVVSSTDGTNWTRAATNTVFTQNNVSLTAVAYGQNTYVTVSGAGRIFTSPDANTWTPRTNPLTTGYQALTAGPASFVAAGASGGIISSADGVTWVSRPSGTTNILRAAAYGNGRYVVAGDSGTIVTSTDGTTWSAAPSGVTTALLAIGYWDAYGFIAVGNTGTMITSTNGTTWQQVETGVADNLTAIANTPIGLVAAGGTNGSLIVSLDGASWSIATLPSGTTIRGLAASTKAIVAVGDSGNTLAFELSDSTPAPVVTSQPISVASVTGSEVRFSVSAQNAVGAVYQWAKDGVPIVGANTPAYAIPAASAVHAGAYTVAITTPTGAVTSAPARLSFGTVTDPGRLVNLSILTALTSRDDTFTFGVVVGGAGTIGSKPLLVRAAGPSLVPLGVTDVLDDPKLEFFTGTTKVGENDNWNGAEAVRTMTAQVAAFPFASAASRDAALALSNLATGASSVKISGTGVGTVIAELYDATPAASFTAATPRLINVSVLKHLGTGVTAGFVIGGSSSRTVLVRAVGPTLGAAPFGVPDVVSDPRLALFAGQAQIGANDNWGGTASLTAAFVQVGAFPLPGTSRDAALLVTLQPGSYTVQVSGVGGVTGVALVEVYEVP